jgi:hypothetical protein
MLRFPFFNLIRLVLQEALISALAIAHPEPPKAIQMFLQFQEQQI